MPVLSKPFKLIPEDGRLTTFPIPPERRGLWKYYEDAYRSFWTVEEVSLSTDALHWGTKLTEGEKRFVKYVLAFFAASDGIVNLNLAKRFKKDIKMLEATYFYDFQIMMENTHAHMYSLLLETIIPNKEEREELLNAIQTIPVIKRMADYMFKCIDSDAPFAERLIRMACVEGVFFTGCFCAIYWLQNRGLMPGLGHSNELIARDEALHTMFAMFVYNMLEEDHKLEGARVQEIVAESVALAKDFISEALPSGLIEMNADMLVDYIQCQADNLVTLIDHPPIYGSKHDFHFMEQINLQNRTNFFERRVSEYSKAATSDVTGYDINYDF